MKKHKIIFILTTISLLMLLVACNNINEAEQSFTFEYSNMVDTETQIFVSELLYRNGVNQIDINYFFELVNDFYNGYENIADSGWITTTLKNFEYNDITAFAHWDSKKRNRIDINCRYAAYTLIKDTILSFDISAFSNIKDENLISEHTLINLADDEIKIYSTLFSDIEVGNVDKNGFTENIILHKHNNKIEFNNESKIKLISLYTQHKSTTAQVAHAAVIIEEDGYYFLLEKYDPLYPYQISKFISKENLLSYLAVRADGEIQHYAIFINNDMAIIYTE